MPLPAVVKVTLTGTAEAVLRVITFCVAVPSATVTGVVMLTIEAPVLMVNTAVSHNAATAPAVGHTL